MTELTCAECGTRFTVREDLAERFPGWKPKTCPGCYRRASGGGRARSGPPGQPPRMREENLPVAEVLSRYTAGPQTGVFTDGSANPNPGPGGWGAVYVTDGEVVDQAHGHEPHTTNNRMELTALIAGIDLVPPGVATTVYTDSRLVVDTLTAWAPGWERAGWKRKTGPIANLDLVQEAYRRVRTRPEIRIEWIAAHSGFRWNEYADSLSTAYLREEL